MLPAARWWSRSRVHPLTHIVQYVKALVPGTDHLVAVRDVVGAWAPDTGNVPVAQPLVGIPAPTLRYTLTSRFVTNAEVLHLQQTLNFWGWKPAGVARVAEDGKFGPQTRDAVKVMQKALHQLEDGVYGPVTAGAYFQLLKLFGLR